MKNIVLGVVMAGVVFSSALAADFKWQDISAGNSEVTAVFPADRAGDSLIIGSAGRVLRAGKEENDWRLLLSVRGDNNNINFFAADPADEKRLYVATGNGLYASPDKGNSWRKVFKGKSGYEKYCTAVAVANGVVYLGTKAGLFTSWDQGRLWHKANGVLGKVEIMNIDSAFGSIYVACADGAYLREAGSPEWKKIYSAQRREVIIYEEGADDSEEQGRNSLINYICADYTRKGQLYLATAIGVYESADNGITWESFDDYGLLSKDVRLLLSLSIGELIAATRRGIFRYTGGRWQELFFGINCDYVRCLIADKAGTIYVGCNNGLFQTAPDTAPDAAYREEPDHPIEPSIQEVQQAAIEYAEVEPEKIIRWRKQAAKKAWLPKVTVSMDQDLNRTDSSNIWGIYASSGLEGRHYRGPDDVTKYNNKNWGVSLSWELGDLIFNGDQTNIDVRSRLMVELRDDILDEVNKTYYERLRVKMELDELSLLDKKRRREKELRLQELAASLDSLTGGYFSQKIKGTP